MADLPYVSFQRFTLNAIITTIQHWSSLMSTFGNLGNHTKFILL